jgi:hypothetical protein
MATKSADTDVVEYCVSCDASTPHTARIELRTESAKETNAEYSREPYRVTECARCGEHRSQRMNNA